MAYTVGSSLIILFDLITTGAALTWAVPTGLYGLTLSTISVSDKYNYLPQELLFWEVPVGLYGFKTLLYLLFFYLRVTLVTTLKPVWVL